MGAVVTCRCFVIEDVTDVMGEKGSAVVRQNAVGLRGSVVLVGKCDGDERKRIELSGMVVV